MELPSGAKWTPDDEWLARRMHAVGFVQFNETPVRLVSGGLSHAYVMGREDLTRDPELLWRVGVKTALLIREHLGEGLVTLMGVPTVGTPFADAASLASWHLRPDNPLQSVVLRPTKKEHGVHGGWVNGKPKPGETVCLVDNVVAYGTSKTTAADHIAEDGFPNRPALFIWIDRQQGAVQKLHDDGFTQIIVAFYLLDLVYAYEAWDLWTPAQAEKFREEIANNQVATPV